MTIPKPIDWTRPLRLIGTHDPVARVTITPVRELPFPISIEYGEGIRRATFQLDRDGRTVGTPEPMVENVPAEPKIIEGWTLVHQGIGDKYVAGVTRIHGSRVDALADGSRCSGCRLAKVLIEEPVE